MTKTIHGDARGEVEVLIALGVPQRAPQSVCEYWSGAAPVSAEDALILILAHGVRVNRGLGYHWGGGDSLSAGEAGGPGVKHTGAGGERPACMGIRIEG